MSRTKGAHNKNHKEKPLKEKKQRGRKPGALGHSPKPRGSIRQKQHQTVNVNINSDDVSQTKKQNIPAQLPSSIFDAAFSNQNYGFNTRPAINPPQQAPELASSNLISSFIKAMSANQQANTQTQPIIIPSSPIKETKPEPKIEKPKPEPKIEQPNPEPIIEQPKPHFTHEDVQHLIDKIHNEHKEIPPIPQDEPKPVNKKIINDVLGLQINDKYDGLKLKNKFIPFNKVIKGTLLGVAGGASIGIAGPSLVNNAISTAASAAGYYIAGEEGAILGGLVGSAGADRLNKSYPVQTHAIHNSGYEEIIPNSSRVGSSGTLISTGRLREPPSTLPRETLISKLSTALKDVSQTRTPVKTKIKESKLLKDLERKQGTYGTINKTDVEPTETKASTFSTITEGVNDLYRRISGQKKGNYSKLSSTDNIDDDFSKALKQSKQSKGTYAILEPPEKDFETEWAAMKEFKTRNEQNIRKSIARTDAEEKKKKTQVDLNQQIAYLMGDDPPIQQLPAYSGLRPSAPLSPARKFMAQSNMNKLSQKLLYKDNIIKQKNIERDVAAFTQKRIEKKIMQDQVAATRSGAAFGATQAQLNEPTRMQLHRERNPELTQLRQQKSDSKRGKIQLTDTEAAAIDARIEQLVAQNKAEKAKGIGPKLGRPEGSKKK